MFAELKLDINCLIHLTGQPYCKRIDQQKDRDGVITYFLGTISLVDTQMNAIQPHSIMIFKLQNYSQYNFE